MSIFPDNERYINYIDSLEKFMVKVAREFNCYPSFSDPENVNTHIFNKIHELKKVFYCDKCNSEPPDTINGKKCTIEKHVDTYYSDNTYNERSTNNNS